MSASNKGFVYVLLTIVVCFLLSSFSPERKKLESEKSNLQKDIQNIEVLQKENKTKQQTSINDLKLLNEKIVIRENAIQQSNQQIDQIDTDISHAQSKIQAVTERANTLENDYAATIRQTYVSQNSYSKLAFIFSSDDFNDAFRRYKYVKSYSDHRKKQFADLGATQDTLEQNILALQVTKDDKTKLLTQQENEKKELENDREKQQQLIANLKTQEVELKASWEEKKEAETNLQNEIIAVIEKEQLAAQKAEEARLAQLAAQKEKEAVQQRQFREQAAKKAAKKQAVAEANIGKTKAIIATAQQKAAKTVAARPIIGQEKVVANTTNHPTSDKPKSSTIQKLTAPATITPPKPAVTFQNSKGNLPWPVRKGYITGKFGTHPHPVLKNITITNNGIDINTSKGASVQTIFEGVVTKKLYTPTFQWAVIVKHGSHFTVYTNLKSTNVKEGDRVSASQTIGIAHSDPKKGGTVVHLEVWEGKKKVNPISWLRKRA